jgi:hypothetical protein
VNFFWGANKDPVGKSAMEFNWGIEVAMVLDHCTLFLIPPAKESLVELNWEIEVAVILDPI